MNGSYLLGGIDLDCLLEDMAVKMLQKSPKGDQVNAYAAEPEASGFEPLKAAALGDHLKAATCDHLKTGHL